MTPTTTPTTGAAAGHPRSMTAETATEPTAPGAPPLPRPARWRRLLAGVRVRILGWYVVLLTLAIGGTLLVARSILLDQLNEEVAEQLVQEQTEIATLATGNDPATGEPFGTDVAALFDTFLRSNLPSQGESFLTLVSGRPYLSTPAPFRLETDSALVDRWSRLGQTERGEVDTPAGPVRYLAVPLRADNETLGVFVVANFVRQQREQIEGAIRVGAAVALSVLVLASVLAWFVAGRLLRPVRLLTETARSIGESDLTRRIHITGSDEVAELGLTFNHMVDRLEQAMNTRRSFLDDAGHELRTPITIVRGHLELLEEDPHERRQTLDLVLDELDRMSRIVDDLLLLAKVEQPDFVQARPVDLGELTRSWHARAVTLADREWRLEQVARAEVVLDSQRMTQAVMNLAQNATQHTEHGTAIDIGSAVAGGEARLWVSDRGPGVRPEDRDRIFERFTRADHERRHSEGAGLGLSIVAAIAAAHGGRVELSERAGGGTTFTIVIPAGAEQPS
ncbi:MAG TPA: HAMP domain-containing sensor histidine kinase [Acidimicrobiales bacterium]|nr:HAMP domain-containing sensor histidine kinase [Acidimicrobiales bacterium]